MESFHLPIAMNLKDSLEGLGITWLVLPGYSVSTDPCLTTLVSQYSFFAWVTQQTPWFTGQTPWFTPWLLVVVDLFLLDWRGLALIRIFH